MAERIITVALVEDNDDIRLLLQSVINADPGFQCTFTYRNGREAVDDFQEGHPDVILMDIEMPEMDGITCVRKIRSFVPDVPVLMLTHHEDDESLFEALRAGATGYLLKGLPASELLDAIRDALDGGAPMSHVIAKKVVRSFRTSFAPDILTDREHEVLKLLCDGNTYKEVATHLYLSKHTVRRHIRSIYGKLQVSTRAEMVVQAQQRGLVR